MTGHEILLKKSCSKKFFDQIWSNIAFEIEFSVPRASPLTAMSFSCYYRFPALILYRLLFTAMAG
jgi:hypothetical protein